MSIHPVIRLISVLVVLAVLPVLSLAGASLFVAVLCISTVLHPRMSLKRVAAAVLRLKWLMVSILVIYFWFTPGTHVFGVTNAFMPTWQGIEAGIGRILVLWGMIGVVYTMLWLTSASETRNAIYDLFRLLRFPEAFSRSIAVRLGTCINTVPVLMDELRNFKRTTENEPLRAKRYLQFLAATLERAESLELVPARGTGPAGSPRTADIPNWQLLIPVALLLAMYGLFMATVS